VTHHPSSIEYVFALETAQFPPPAPPRAAGRRRRAPPLALSRGGVRGPAGA
jgi:hypothetical protein